MFDLRHHCWTGYLQQQDMGPRLPDYTGIFQGGNNRLDLRYSGVVGFTKTVETVHNVGMVWTELIEDRLLEVQTHGLVA